MIRVAINGAGRIGRAFLKLALSENDIEIVAVNDLSDIENIAYLLKYDTVYGKSSFIPVVGQDKKSILIYGKSIKYYSEKEPAKLPWKNLGIDVVIESTGFFTTYEKANIHITAGAKRVVITAPSHGEHESGQHPLGATVLVGINHDKLSTCQISSNASCTTNASAPVIQILHEAIGIEKALLNTTHALTTSQRIVDSPNEKDMREGRASGANIIPSATGAAVAVTKAIPELDGKFDGIAMRVPIIAGSIADVTFISKKDTTVEEVNEILKKAAETERWRGIFTVTNEPLVSSDIIGSTYGSIADLNLTRVIGGNLVKVCAWYDNEMGYTATLVKHVLEMGKYI